MGERDCYGGRGEIVIGERRRENDRQCDILLQKKKIIYAQYNKKNPSIVTHLHIRTKPNRVEKNFY